MRPLLSLAVFVLSCLGYSCLNDIDTLRQNQQRFPELIDVIVGRFDRNPKLYYRMRIDRELPLLRSDPANLQLYDDISVAYDRLGNDVAAIEVIQRKGRLLQSLGSKAPQYHLYSFNANIGTFLIHDFIQSGANLASIERAKAAQMHISKAVEIKPDAHFYREPVQLAAIQWIIDVVERGKKRVFNPHDYIQLDMKKTLAGLQGLVVLGAAWESVDIFEAINQYPLLMTRGQKVRKLAQLRIHELMANGRKSLAAKNGLDVYDNSNMLRDGIYPEYLKLRANADLYVKNREDFMLAKMKSGSHPDTDPHFWDGYKEIAPYKIPWTLYEPWHSLGQLWQSVIIYLGTILAGVGLTVYVLKKLRERRRLRAPRSIP